MEAHLYDELARQEDRHWWFRGRRAVIRSVVERHLPPPPRRILDVGCGTGGMLQLLSEFGTVEGLESSDDALRLCRERIGDAAKLHKGLIPDDLPRDGSFDVVTAFDVLEHLDDPVGGMRGMRAVLRSGGIFICAVPAFRFLWSEHDDVHHHRTRYTRDDLRKQLLEAGFDVQFMSYFNTLLFPPIALARVLRKVLPRGVAGGSDLKDAPALLNSALGALFSAERLLVPHLPLPVGVSIVAVGSAGAPS